MRKFLLIVFSFFLAAVMSAPAYAQRRGGNGGNRGSGNDGASARRGDSGGRSYSSPVDRRSYGTAVARQPMPMPTQQRYQGGSGYAVARRPMPSYVQRSPYQGGNRSYGPSMPRSYGSYSRSYTRPFVGRSYYRRGDWYGYYGNGLFVPIYDLLAWSRFAPYAVSIGRDSWMFRQQVPDPYGYGGQFQADSGYDGYNDGYGQQGQQMAPSPVQPLNGGEQYSPAPYQPQPGTRIPSLVEIQPSCPSGQVMFKNDTGSDVDVAASGVSMFIMLAGGNSCRDWVSGLQWDAHKHSTMATEGSGETTGSRLIMNPTPICFEGDNQGVVHLRNSCSR